jgi:hypothetical protein
MDRVSITRDGCKGLNVCFGYDPRQLGRLADLDIVDGFFFGHWEVPSDFKRLNCAMRAGKDAMIAARSWALSWDQPAISRKLRPQPSHNPWRPDTVHTRMQGEIIVAMSWSWDGTGIILFGHVAGCLGRLLRPS